MESSGEGGAAGHGGTGGPAAAARRLVAVTLDEASIARTTRDIDHERAIAIYDLVEENTFAPVGDTEDGPYKLTLAIRERRLVLDITRPDGRPVATHLLSLSPFRGVLKDYFLICESYYQAIRSASPSQIEAIDMGRRGIHNEGSQLLMERLEGKIEIDFDTARRLFTLICALHWKG
ncbi:UPF0262 family protein [Segnochrobactrum spirostomi]|uniref:UPF0262 protein F0357_10905 n=1 Tax=Segnochrobactrum spirostomi TaxID=2608987 RepID=A0A6A7Y4W7_9HYPH|nr:UPF0262 family protein [Segnochrobactrum spirostomi]MQT13141.1 UPF0262 family protein [Segnochrobactrum spirostomi]